MKTFHILNLGAGVQSTALYLMSLRQDEPEHVPMFDFAIFADTQEEPKAVYEHLEWLKTLGGPPILEDTAGKLGDDLIRGFRRKRPGKTAVGFKQIPAFQATTPGKLEGKGPRHCTGYYKIDVVTRVIRERVLGVEFGKQVPDGMYVVQYFGLSYEEAGRCAKTRARFQGIAWAEPRFPLYEMVMRRYDCLAYLAECDIPHPVPRSACTFCPYRDNASWLSLREGDPDGWNRAVEVDSALRGGAVCAVGLDAKLYLHRSCVPLSEANIEELESPYQRSMFGFDQECEGMCGL